MKIDNQKLDLFFLLFIAAVLLCFYQAAIFGNATYYAADHSLYFEPLSKYIGEAFKQGHLPLWNPYVHCGMPEVAVPSPGIFYVPNLLFALMPYGKALAWLLLAHQIIAGFGFYLLILSFRWRQPAAFAGGLIGAYSGYMFSLGNNYTLVSTIVWLPFCLYFLRETCLAKTQARILIFVSLTALAIALMLTAGRPELSVPGALIVLGFSCLQSLRKTPTDSSEKFFSSCNFSWQIVALTIGVLISMPVILPVVEWLLNSPRAKGIGVNYALMWSANWYDIFTMIFPPPFGDLRVLGAPYLNFAASRANHLPLVPSSFIGPVAFTLAIIGLCGEGFVGRKWVMAIMLGTLLMALGENSWIVPKLMAVIPYATIFRYPIKLIVIAIFSLVLLAAWGLHKVEMKDVSKNALKIAVLIWIVGIIVGLSMTLASIFHKPAPLVPYILVGQSLLVGSFIGLTTSTLVRFAITGSTDSSNIIRMIFALLFFSLIIPSLYLRPDSDSVNFYSHRSYLIDELDHLAKSSADNSDRPRLLRLYFDPLKVPDKYTWGNGSSKNANYFQYCRDLLLPNTNIDFSQPTTYGYEAAETGDLRNLMLSAINRSTATDSKKQDNGKIDQYLFRVCRASAARWVVSQIDGVNGPIRKLQDQYFDLLSEKPEMNLRIYGLKQPLPRAFVSKNWCWTVSHRAVLNQIQNDNIEFDPELTTLVEPLKEKNNQYSVLLPPTSADNSQTKNNESSGRLLDNAVFTQAGVIYPGSKTTKQESTLKAPTFLVNTPEHISIGLQIPKETFLVLADQYYPGWVAHIDSVLAPIYRVNGVFKAVYLSRGGHLVEFDYEPDSVRIGLWCAAVGGALLAWFLLVATWPWFWRKIKQSAGQV